MPIAMLLHADGVGKYKQVRFQFLTVASMKMAVFWVIVPCSLVEVCHCFRGAYCLHHQGDHSEMLTYFYQTTQPNSQEDSYLQVQTNFFCLR
jgi:hypothetical protein